MTIRPSLRWTGAGALALTAYALVMDGQRPTTGVVAAAEFRAPRATGQNTVASLAAGARPSTTPASSPLPWPTEWPVVNWSAPRGDPFKAKNDAPPSPPTPPVAPMQAAPQPVESASAAPEANLRFLGRFTQPDGQVRVYLARGTEVGDLVDGGCAVASIEPAAVRLSCSADGSHRVIPIPEAAPAQ